MIETRFNSEIYSQTAISIAAEAYKDLAEISISDTPEGFLVIFDQCEYDEEQTVKEFGNYVIDVMNQRNGNN